LINKALGGDANNNGAQDNWK